VAVHSSPARSSSARRLFSRFTSFTTCRLLDEQSRERLLDRILVAPPSSLRAQRIARREQLVDAIMAEFDPAGVELPAELHSSERVLARLIEGGAL